MNDGLRGVDLGMDFFAVIQAVPAASPGASPANDIRAILPPEPYFISGSPWLLILAGACILVAGILAWLLLRPRAKPPVPPIPPRELARQRLAALATRMATIDARAFGAEICDVLRAYIGGEYHLQPERQTSPEFLAAISNARVFSRREQDLLTEFLEDCDLLKFARQDATLEAKRGLLAQAADFVEHGERLPIPPPLPGPPAPPVATVGV